MTIDPSSRVESSSASRPTRWNAVSIWLFTLAVFSSAILLFVLEPLFAKIILPVFGGSPAVWITCMVFFQVALLLGYFYSHLVSSRLTKTLVGIHIAGLALSCLALPIAVRGHVDVNTAVYHPSLSLLIIATASIGLPFFFLSTTAPLLQRWFSHTAHPDAADPYFLYAASNAGSLLGLALYPALLEPNLSLSRQASVWSFAYLFLAVLIASCGALALRERRTSASDAVGHTSQSKRTEEFLWLALAFVPASLLYGVTAQLSTDFPPIPLLWVVPLGIYLLTFIVGFSAGLKRLRSLGRLLPTVILFATALYTVGSLVPSWAITGVLKLACFALIALALHTELALRRPATDQLTRFYLFVSFGGVLAGVLNGLVAPLVFSDYLEYPITLVLAAMLLPFVRGTARRPMRPLVLCMSLALLSIAVILVRLPAVHLQPQLRIAVFVIALLICFRIPLRWAALGVFMLLLFGGHLGQAGPEVIYQARSFYGVYKVKHDVQGNMHTLTHGTTLHGAQPLSATTGTSQHPVARAWSETDLSGSSYYGPVGPIVANVREQHPVRLGVVGLGAGTTACFAASNETVTFFEIDPLVERIARDPKYFTYLTQCPGRNNVVLGDARLTLSQVVPHSFNVLIIDAFSSDAIPMHLLTTQAFEVYRRALADDGILMVHVSNRYLDLQPVVLGSAHFPGHKSLFLSDNLTEDQIRHSRLTSKWVVLAPEQRAQALDAAGFHPATAPSLTWTDDRSSLFSVISWSRLLNLRQVVKELTSFGTSH